MQHLYEHLCQFRRSGSQGDNPRRLRVAAIGGRFCGKTTPSPGVGEITQGRLLAAQGTIARFVHSNRTIVYDDAVQRHPLTTHTTLQSMSSTSMGTSAVKQVPQKSTWTIVRVGTDPAAKRDTT